MLWYSDNSFSKYRDLSLSTFDYSAFGLAKVDCHFVWTNEFASFLSQFTKVSVKNVGSILFYEAQKFDLSGNSTLTDHKAASDVIIFDVIPFEKSNNYDYYTKSRAFNFLFGIQKLFEEFQKSDLIVQPKFAIKHKRKLDPKHSKEYPSLVNSLIHPQGKWERLPENSNLYNLIRNAKLIVAPPFTSPAVVARELGIPACFLDLGSNPTEFENYCGIPVFRNYEAFSSFATRVLKSSL
jgi:polysaccharide biosynthesis PFTS motif protein